MFTTTNFPDASTANLTRSAELYALLTGRVQSIPGTAPSGRGHRRVRLQRLLRAEVEADAVRGLPPGLVAHEADADGECRPALGSALPFTAVTPTYSAATMEDICGISGVGAGPGGRAVQSLQTGHADRRCRYRACDLYEPGSRRTTRIGRTSRPTSASPGGRTRSAGFLRTLLGDPEQATIRAGYAHELSTRSASIGSRTAPATIPGGDINVIRNTDDGLSARPPGREPSGALPRAQSPRSAELPGVAGLSDRSRRRPTTSRCSSRICGRRACTPTRRVPALDRRRHGGRSALRRQPEPLHLGRGELERAQHHRERLPHEFRLGAGQPQAPTWRPTGQRVVRLHGRAGHRSRCRSISRTSAAAPTRPTRRPTRRRSSPTRRSSPGSARSSRKCSNAASDLDTTAFRANAARAGFVPNFFVMNPAVANANVVEDRELDKVRQPAARSAPPPVAAVCSSRATTPTASARVSVEPIAALRSVAGRHHRRARTRSR